MWSILPIKDKRNWLRCTCNIRCRWYTWYMYIRCGWCIVSYYKKKLILSLHFVNKVVYDTTKLCKVEASHWAVSTVRKLNQQSCPLKHSHTSNAVGTSHGQTISTSRLWLLRRPQALAVHYTQLGAAYAFTPQGTAVRSVMCSETLTARKAQCVHGHVTTRNWQHFTRAFSVHEATLPVCVCVYPHKWFSLILALTDLKNNKFNVYSKGTWFSNILTEKEMKRQKCFCTYEVWLKSNGT